MPEQSTVQLARQFQAQAAARDQATVNTLATEWLKIEDALNDDLVAALDELSGIDPEDITANQVFKAARTQELIGQASVELDFFLDEADSIIDTGTRIEMQMAREQQAEMLRELTRKQLRRAAAAQSFTGSFSALPAAQVQNMLSLTQGGGPLRDLFESAGPQAIQGMLDRMTLGLARGENPRRAARAVWEEGFAKGLSQVETIMRDQYARAYRTAAQQAYQESGLVDGYIRIAAKQERTCVACLALDGTEYETEELMELHPQDRCTMIPKVAGFRPPQFEKGSDWLRRQPKAKQKAILGGLYDHYDSGAMGLDEMVVFSHDPTWGPTARTISPKAANLRVDGRFKQNLSRNQAQQLSSRTQDKFDDAGVEIARLGPPPIQTPGYLAGETKEERSKRRQTERRQLRSWNKKRQGVLTKYGITDDELKIDIERKKKQQRVVKAKDDIKKLGPEPPQDKIQRSNESSAEFKRRRQKERRQLRAYKKKRKAVLDKYELTEYDLETGGTPPPPKPKPKPVTKTIPKKNPPKSKTEPKKPPRPVNDLRPWEVDKVGEFLKKASPRTLDAHHDAVVAYQHWMNVRGDKTASLTHRTNAKYLYKDALYDFETRLREDDFDKLHPYRDESRTDFKTRMSPWEKEERPGKPTTKAEKDEFRRRESESRKRLHAMLSPETRGRFNRIDPEIRMNYQKKPGRASHSGSLGGSTLNIFGNSRERTYLHEWGHAWELHDPKLHANAVDFYHYRTKGEELEWLGPGYDESEEYRPDKWLDEYMGKIYDHFTTSVQVSDYGQDRNWVAPRRRNTPVPRNEYLYDENGWVVPGYGRLTRSRNTELVSMGVEMIWDKPGKMIIEDPEYFNFIKSSMDDLEGASMPQPSNFQRKQDQKQLDRNNQYLRDTGKLKGRSRRRR